MGEDNVTMAQGRGTVRGGGRWSREALSSRCRRRLCDGRGQSVGTTAGWCIVRLQTDQGKFGSLGRVMEGRGRKGTERRVGREKWWWQGSAGNRGGWVQLAKPVTSDGCRGGRAASAAEPNPIRRNPAPRRHASKGGRRLTGSRRRSYFFSLTITSSGQRQSSPRPQKAVGWRPAGRLRMNLATTGFVPDPARGFHGGRPTAGTAPDGDGITTDRVDDNGVNGSPAAQDPAGCWGIVTGEACRPDRRL